MKFVYVRLSGGQVGQSRFNPVGGPVKVVEASLYARKDLESSFHHCGGPVMLVHLSFSASKAAESRFTTGMSYEVRVGSFEWWVSRSKPF